MNPLWPMLFAITAGMAVYCLIAGRVPARWPSPTVSRKDNPLSFWFTVGVYLIGAWLTAGMAFREISSWM